MCRVQSLVSHVLFNSPSFFPPLQEKDEHLVGVRNSIYSEGRLDWSDSHRALNGSWQVTALQLPTCVWISHSEKFSLCEMRLSLEVYS